MVKNAASAGELIWLVHEKFAASNFAHANIAIISIGDGNCSALTSATEEELMQWNHRA
jgi:hypothetical protein